MKRAHQDSATSAALVSVKDLPTSLLIPETVSLVLLYGSWNRLDITTAALALLSQTLADAVEARQELHGHGHGIQRQRLHGQVLAVQVDESDESLHRLCDLQQGEPTGGGGGGGVGGVDIQAPADLPALGLYNPDNRRWLHLCLESKIIQLLINYNNTCTSSSLLVHSSKISSYSSYTIFLRDAISKALDKSLIVTSSTRQDHSMIRIQRTTPKDDSYNNTLPYSTHEKNNSEAVPIIHQPLRIFIAGDKTQVGKSTICLGLLGSLLAMQYQPHELAYIKPATQCEATTLVAQFCSHHGIDAVPIGPLVYYRGFTRSFLRGELGDTSESLLDHISHCIDDLAYGRKSRWKSTSIIHDDSFHNKKIIIIDGVGYPAVGSICGTDNADVARACGYPYKGDRQDDDPTSSEYHSRRPAPVLLVGKSGIGDAIDSYNLNATYFTCKNIPVIGAIFNRFSTDPNDYYNLDRCKESIEFYFQQNKHGRRTDQVFGFLPELLEPMSLPTTLDADSTIRINNFISLFSSHVHVQGILDSALALSQDTALVVTPGVDESSHIDKKVKKVMSTGFNASITHVFLSRDEIEATAKRLGAASG